MWRAYVKNSVHCMKISKEQHRTGEESSRSEQLGKMRAWGNHMVHHAIYHKQNYSYAGIMETLSGAPFDVQFLTFDEVKENPDILKDIDVILNVGDGDTAYTGGANWEDADLVLGN